jgi:Restriction endonuclease
VITLAFETYERVATFLLNEFADHFGLKRVEGKQDVQGLRSGTTWEIDGKGVKTDGEAFILVECRRYTDSKPNQEALAALAYRIRDTGAAGGIIVTPLGIQEGAAKVARAEEIVSVLLDASSTTSDYVLKFLNNVMIGASLKISAAAGLEVSADVIRRCTKCGARFSPKSMESLCSRCSA